MARTSGRFIACAAFAVLGLAAFGAFAWRSVRTEHADATEAKRRFEDVRKNFLTAAPLVHMDPSGRLIRNDVSARRGDRPTRLYVLVYRSAEERLIEADAPLWFLKVKGPAVDYAFRGTGFSLATLGLTASDIENAGAGLVFDQTEADRNGLLVWTE